MTGGTPTTTVSLYRVMRVRCRAAGDCSSTYSSLSNFLDILCCGKTVDNSVSNGYTPPMHPLQEKILALIDSHNLGQMTLREIGELVGERFPQKIKHHLVQLEK